MNKAVIFADSYETVRIIFPGYHNEGGFKRHQALDIDINPDSYDISQIEVQDDGIEDYGEEKTVIVEDKSHRRL